MAVDAKILRARAFDGLEAAVVIADLDGTIVDLNLAALMLFEYQKDELLGQKIEILVPPEVRQHHMKLRERYQQDLQHRMMAREKRSVVGLTSEGFELNMRVKLEPLNTLEGMFIAAEIYEVD